MPSQPEDDIPRPPSDPEIGDLGFADATDKEQEPLRAKKSDPGQANFIPAAKEDVDPETNKPPEATPEPSEDDFNKTWVPEAERDTDISETFVPPMIASDDKTSIEDSTDPPLLDDVNRTWVPASDITHDGLNRPTVAGPDNLESDDATNASMDDTWVPPTTNQEDYDPAAFDKTVVPEDPDSVDKTWVPTTDKTHVDLSSAAPESVDGDKTYVPTGDLTVDGLAGSDNETEEPSDNDDSDPDMDDVVGKTAVIEGPTEIVNDTVVIDHSPEQQEDAFAETLAVDVDPGMGQTQFSQTLSGRDLSPAEYEDWQAAIEEKTIGDTDIFDHPDSGDQQANTQIWSRQSADGLSISLTIRKRPVDGEGPFEGGVLKTDKPDYQVIEKLAEGGMGAIYVARQTSLDRELAIKTLKDMRPSELRTYQKQGRVSQVEKQRREMFFSEALVTGNLVHPHIIPIHDLCQTGDGTPFYSMKRVYGTPWNETITTLPLEENLEVLHKVCDAMAYAHHKGVVNRDLKPENIMLGEFGEVLVLDWGLAVPATRDDKKKFHSPAAPYGAGTPAYMSPELWTGPAKAIGPWSDIYLLGAILFEIVTGESPHDFPEPDKASGNTGLWLVIDKVVRKNRIRSTEHKGELIDIAQKAMSTKPHQRHDTVLEFQEAVKEFQRHEESRRLTERADLTLGKHSDEKHSQSPDDYQAYQTATALYQEAHNTWPENQEAETSLRTARKQYAELAFTKGDYDLGLQVAAQESDEEFDTLRRKLERARRMRNSLKTAITAAVLAIIGIGVFASYKSVQVAQQRDEIVKLAGTKEQLTAEVTAAEVAQAEAETRKAQAEQQAKEAATLVATAKVELQQANQKKQEAETQLEESETNLVIANNRLQAANQKTDEANRQLKTAETQRADAERKSREADRQLMVANQSIQNSKTEIANLETEKQRLDTEKIKATVELENAAIAGFVRSADYPRALKAIETMLQKDSSLQQLPEIDRQYREQELKARRRQLQRRMKSNDTPIRSQVIGPQGQKIAWCDSNGKLSLYKRSSDSTSFPESASASIQLPASATDLLLLQNDRILASVGQNLILWNTDRKEFTTIKEHTAPITSLASDGAFLLTGDQQGTIKGWQIGDLNPTWSMTVNSSIRDLVLLPDAGIFLYAGSRGGQSADVMAYRLPQPAERPERLGQLRFPRTDNHPPSMIAVSPDERLLVIGNSRNGDLLVLPRRNTENASRFDRFPFQHAADLAETDELGWKQSDHSRPVNDLQFSANGRRFVSASDDRTIGIWQRKDDTLVLKTRMRGHGARVISARFLDNEGNQVSSASADRYCRLWNVRTYADERRQIERDFEVAEKAGRKISAVTRPEKQDAGRYITTHVRAPSQPDALVLNTHGEQQGSINAIAFSDDGQRLITGAADGTAVVWDTTSGQPLGDASIRTSGDQFSSFDEGHDFNMARLRFLPPEGKTLLTSGFDGTLCLWNADLEHPGAGAQQVRIPGLGLVNATATSSDGLRIATSISQGPNTNLGTIAIWKTESLLEGRITSPEFRLTGYHNADISALAFHPTANVVASGGRDGRVAIWDLQGGELLAGSRLHAKNTIVSHLEFLPSGQLLSAGFDGKIQLLEHRQNSGTSELGKLTVVQTFQHDRVPVERLAVSPDGSRFVTISVRTDKATRKAESQLELWDTNTRRRIQQVMPATVDHEPVRRIASVNWSINGDQFCAVVNDRVQLFDTQSWKVSKVLRATDMGISDAVFTPGANNQNLLATFDGTAAHFWDLADYSHLADFRPLYAIQSLAMTKIGTSELLLTGDRSVHVFQADAQASDFGQTLCKISDPHGGLITSLSIDPTNSSRFVTSSADGASKLWVWNSDRQAATELKQLLPPGEATVASTWSTTGDLAIVKKNGTIEIILHEPAIAASNLPSPHFKLTSRNNATADTNRRQAEFDIVLHGNIVQRGNIVQQINVVAEGPVELKSGAWSEDGRFFVAAGKLTLSGTSQAWVYDLTDKNQPVLHTTVSGHSAGGINAVTFLPESPYLVTGGSDGAVYIWNFVPHLSDNAKAYEAFQMLPVEGQVAHQAPVTALSASENGRSIVTASEDGTAIIWQNPFFTPTRL